MIRVNGVDLRDLGFVARSRSLPRLGGERSIIQQIPGRIGGVRMGGELHDDTLTVEGYISAPSHSMLLDRIERLSALLRGRCVIQFTDYLDVEGLEITGHSYDGPDMLFHLASGREWVGYLQQGPSRTTPIGPAWVTRYENVTLQWVLPDPTARARTETVQRPGALLLGTAPSPLRIEVANGETAKITKIVVEVLRNNLHNPGFEDLGAYWSSATASREYLDDPALAYTGRGCAQITVTSGGGQDAIAQTDNPAGGGPNAFVSVTPGDLITFGVWTYRVSGTGFIRPRIWPYDANKQGLPPWQINGPSRSETGVWVLSTMDWTVPEGVAFIRYDLQVLNGPTVGRFDNAFLAIRRPGQPRRILEWHGELGVGETWVCDAETGEVSIDGANAIDGLTAASELPIAAPGPGGYDYVLVTVTGGGGHETTVQYRRRWL